MWFNVTVILNDPEKTVVEMLLHERKLPWVRQNTFVHGTYLYYSIAAA